MEPLFSAECLLVAWTDGATVFDVSMRPVAFVSDRHAWSLPGRWLGPVDGLNLLDRDGKPVAWNPGQEVRGVLLTPTPMPPKLPIMPMVPIPPKLPLPPVAPLPPGGGWSVLSFEAWWAVDPTPPPVPPPSDEPSP